MSPLVFIYQTLRPFLGLTSCIYPVSCGRYAIEQLQTKPCWVSVPMIVLRLLSCNPVIGFIRFIKFKRALRELE